MPAAEFAVWVEFYRRFGFPADRHEWGTALAGEYIGGSLGGKAKARDLIPRFQPPKPQSAAVIKAWFDSLPRVKEPASNGG